MRKYEYLWVDDRGEFMALFLKYNHVPTQEEIEEAGDEGMVECPPTLEQFKEQVTSFPFNRSINHLNKTKT